MKVIGDGGVWYGSGYCGVCGDLNIEPLAVRYWDCDDGWRVGVLCACCADECHDRGPQPDDYAYSSVKHAQQAEIIDMTADVADADCAYAMQDEVPS